MRVKTYIRNTKNWLGLYVEKTIKYKHKTCNIKQVAILT